MERKDPLLLLCCGQGWIFACLAILPYSSVYIGTCIRIIVYIFQKPVSACQLRTIVVGGWMHYEGSAAQRMNFEFRGNLIEKQYLDVGDCMHICETSQNDHSTFVPQVLTNLILTLFNFSLRSFGRILFVRRI